MATVVRFVQDTLTLKHPTLSDLVAAVARTAPGTLFDLDYNRLGGKVKTGLALSVVPGTKTILNRTWVISQDNITIQDGTIELIGSYDILITGKNVTFKNVTVSGPGRRGMRHTDPYLIRVAKGGQLSLNQCIIECESREAHALLVDSEATCTIASTRVYGGGVGCAVKVCGGTVSVNKRSLLQGGVMVSSPQPCTQAATKLDAAAATGMHPLPGEHPDIFSQALLAAATATLAQPADGQQPDRGISLRATQTQPALEHAGTPFESQPSTRSRLEMRNSEVLAGPVACLVAHGLGSSVFCDSCHLGGQANYGVLASHGASMELIACEVAGTSTAGVTISGGAKLHATNSSVSAAILGLRAQTGATATLSSCTLTSTQAVGGEPLPLPAAPKPGQLADFLPAIPAPAEARGRGAAIIAKDCTFGLPGVQGWRMVSGGQVAVQEGLEEGLKPLLSLS